MRFVSRFVPSLIVVVSGGTHARSACGQLAWDSTRWHIEAEAARVEQHEGRASLLLQNGIAWFEGAALRDGVIQFDLHVTADLGFHGLAFRAADHQNYEHFYLRPFVSGNPDASQYTPVFHDVSGWQVYSGPQFGQSVLIPTGQWIHVEIRILGGRAEAHVDGVPLVFPALQRTPIAGAIGLTSSGAPARFANVVISSVPPTMAAGDGPPNAPLPPGVVRQWRVSTPFSESRLDSLGPLPRELVDGLDWAALEVEGQGVANLARLRGVDPMHNTVFAAVTLRTPERRTIRIRLGFSDRVHVYLNGRPVYRAADGWRSRDYKFLGTVGLFDELVLALEAGDNDIWLAVSESFGGWGVILQIVDADRVEVIETH